MKTIGEPGFQTFGKVSNCLSKRSGNWTEDFRHQEIHNALVEDVITGVEKVYDRLAAGEKEELVLW